MIAIVATLGTVTRGIATPGTATAAVTRIGGIATGEEDQRTTELRRCVKSAIAKREIVAAVTDEAAAETGETAGVGAGIGTGTGTATATATVRRRTTTTERATARGAAGMRKTTTGGAGAAAAGGRSRPSSRRPRARRMAKPRPMGKVATLQAAQMAVPRSSRGEVVALRTNRGTLPRPMLVPWVLNLGPLRQGWTPTRRMPFPRARQQLTAAGSGTLGSNRPRRREVSRGKRRARAHRRNGKARPIPRISRHRVHRNRLPRHR
mmetsp:Transcript_69608/g.193693  ORF Transcript_69608/g.193693 Transcript_69608/m.193693 type:complete len:264 (+) Transcript_69608:1552-2343(+)